MSASSTTAGRFRFTPAAARWWWSDELFRIHGMEPGDVVPTRDLFLSHVHRDDRASVDDTLEPQADVEARSCEYRLTDLAGTERLVTLVLANEGPGGAVGTAGFVVDDTAVREVAVADRVNQQLAVALESHAAIDQAKGVLMLTYGVDDEAAFDVLRASSQRLNVRLRTLASRVMTAVDGGLDDAARLRIDAVLDDAGSTPTAGRPTRPASGASLSLRTDARAAPPTLHVAGCVDLSTRDDLAAALALLLLQGRATGEVRVDLRGVRRIGCVVGEVVTTTMQQCAAQGVVVTIVGGPLATGAQDAPPRRTMPGGVPS